MQPDTKFKENKKYVQDYDLPKYLRVEWNTWVDYFMLCHGKRTYHPLFMKYSYINFPVVLGSGS